MKPSLWMFVLSTALLLGGCATARIESLASLEGQSEAIAFHGRDEQRRVGAKVSVAGLPEILARATWVASRPAHKGGSWLRFASDREVFLPVGFAHFYVANVPGHFEVRSEDLGRYREISGRILKAANEALARMPAANIPPTTR
jgi:hypothetical protein